MGIPNLEDLMSKEVSSGFEPIPVGYYNGVITGAEVRKGNKGPYINVEVTLHDEEVKGRKIWGISSFSEKALTMPGGVVNLLQLNGLQIDMDTPSAEIPNALAAAIKTVPVTVKTKNEQIVRNGVPQTLPDGSPELSSKVESYADASDEFMESVELDAQGIDGDLPF